MKKKNKIFNRVVAGTLIIGLLTAIGIGAYLTDTDVKQDVYTVGNVQAEIVANGDMELDNVGALLPGTVHQYERAAMNTGINDAFVFMSITIPYEMVGVSDEDGTQLGERMRQLFIPGSADGNPINAEWKLVDVGFIGEYEIEENGMYCGEHDNFSTVVGNTITYVYGYIGDNADGSLKALTSGETTSNIVDTMKLTNLYHIDSINGSISTKLYAIQSNNVNGGLTDVNGVWAVINKSLVGDVETETSTLTYDVINAITGEGVSYAPLKLVDGNGKTVFLSIATENGSGQFKNVPVGEYTLISDIGDLSLNGAAGYARVGVPVVITEEDSYISLRLTNANNTIVNGVSFNNKIPYDVTSVEFVAMPQTYGLRSASLPDDAFDVSEDGSGSVMAWVEGTTMYVTALDGGKVYANPDSSYMFFYKSDLTYINTENLDTSKVTNGKYMFYYCTSLTNDVEDFDLGNMRGLDYAFEGCSWLTEFEIPEGTVSIPEGAFQDTGLTSIVIPSSVKKIGAFAFQSTDLTSVVIPDGVEQIGDSAFAGCSLTEVSLPASITNLGLVYGSPFTNCETLTTINVDPANENYVSIDGVLYTKDMKTLVQYPMAKSNTAYVIPNGVEKIEAHAFEDCNNLTTVGIPTGVKYIGNSAFAGCNRFGSIDLPDGVEVIGDGAFQNCSELLFITIPTSVKEIGAYALASTPWLENNKVEGQPLIINNIFIDVNNVYGNVIIPEGVTEIPESLFEWNDGITSVTIPASVTSIGDFAFSGCVNLETVIIANNSKLTYVGNSAFSDCSKLSYINLPDSVTTIGGSAFSWCTSLTSVNISNKVTNLENTFSYSGLTSITIPENIEIIDGAFMGCADLTEINIANTNENYASVDGVLFTKDMKTLLLYPAGKADSEYTIPNGVETLNDFAFSGNTNLTKVNIPTSIKVIGMYCFDCCYNIETFNYLGTDEQWNEIEFGYGWNEIGEAPEVEPEIEYSSFNIVLTDNSYWVVDPYYYSLTLINESNGDGQYIEFNFNSINSFYLPVDDTISYAAHVRACVLVGQSEQMVECKAFCTINYYNKVINITIFDPENIYCRNGYCSYCAGCINTYCADCSPLEHCPGHHVCESVCVECGLCLDTSCVEEVCSDKCQGHEVEVEAGTINLSIVTDYNNWSKTLSHYEFEINNKTYRVEIDQTTPVTLPVGTYDVVVYAVFDDGSRETSVQDRSSVTVRANRTSSLRISFGEASYNWSINVNDLMDWGDKTVAYYEISVDNNALTTTIEPNSAATFNVSRGSHSIEVIIHFTDGTSISANDYQDTSIVSVTKDTITTINFGYTLTISLIDNCEWETEPMRYTITLSNGTTLNTMVSNAMLEVILAPGTYEVTSISVRLSDGTINAQYELLMDGEPVSAIVVNNDTQCEIVINNTEA